MTKEELAEYIRLHEMAVKEQREIKEKGREAFPLGAIDAYEMDFTHLKPFEIENHFDENGNKIETRSVHSRLKPNSEITEEDRRFDTAMRKVKMP